MPPGLEHTVKVFDEEIRQLRGLVSDMGGRAEIAISEAIDALARADHELAAHVLVEDRKIDQLEIEVERMAVQLIALRAPLADDLREVVAAIKIAGVIERIGDYAKNIAKRVPLIDASGAAEQIAPIPPMASIAIEMVRDVLDAYAARDAEKARLVHDRDQQVDNFYAGIFRSLVASLANDPEHVADITHLLFIAKNLERIGDHATNVAEMVYFAATGAQLADRERGEDPTLGEEF